MTSPVFVIASLRSNPVNNRVLYYLLDCFVPRNDGKVTGLLTNDIITYYVYIQYFWIASQARNDVQHVLSFAPV